MIIYYKHTKRSDIIEHRFLCKNISQIRRKNYNDYTCTTKNLDIKPSAHTCLEQPSLLKMIN
jgi:hypothetical protein